MNPLILYAWRVTCLTRVKKFLQKLGYIIMFRNKYKSLLLCLFTECRINKNDVILTGYNMAHISAQILFNIRSFNFCAEFDKEHDFVLVLQHF